MIFRQLYDRDSCTFTYLLGDEWSREAVLIDPVRELVDRDASVVRELNLNLVMVLDTHAHADHITGASLLRARLGCKIASSKAAGVFGGDLQLEDGDAIRFGLQALEVRATPGHTQGCISYVSANGGLVFTGDALFIRGCGRTDFQGGDARTLYRSVRDKIFSLPDDSPIFPGHDYKGRTKSTVREEKLYNPRLGGGRTEDEFVAIMEGLKLGHPRKMDVAVPANLRAGWMDGDDDEPIEAGADEWPLYRTPTGAPNIPPSWVAANPDVRRIDVRELHELMTGDGELEGSEHVPMAELLDAASEWDREAPVVLYCRVGGRSDMSAKKLEGAGFTRVASMTGGIAAWASQGLPLRGRLQG